MIILHFDLQPQFKYMNYFIYTLHQFQPVWYFSENDVIFSNSQPRLGTRKINGGRKFSEIKVQKT